MQLPWKEQEGFSASSVNVPPLCCVFHFQMTITLIILRHEDKQKKPTERRCSLNLDDI